jgi:hypothetical protein
MWNRFTSTIFAAAAAKRPVITKAEEYAYALTSVANLDWQNSTKEADIERSRLENGCPIVWNVIEASRPRIVVALTNSVWDVFGPTVAKHKYGSFFYDGPSVRMPFLFKITSQSAPSLFFKSPRHPSYPLSSAHREQIGQIVTRFMELPQN